MGYEKNEKISSSFRLASWVVFEAGSGACVHGRSSFSAPSLNSISQRDVIPQNSLFTNQLSNISV